MNVCYNCYLISKKKPLYTILSKFLLKTPQPVKKDFDDLGPSWQQAEPNLHQPIKNLTRGFNHSRRKELTDFDSTTNLLLLYHTQLPGRLFSPSDISKKLSHHFLMHLPIGMGSYDHHAKYQGVFMDLK